MLEITSVRGCKDRVPNRQRELTGRDKDEERCCIGSGAGVKGEGKAVASSIGIKQHGSE